MKINRYTMRIMDKELNHKYVTQLYEKSRKYVLMVFLWLLPFTLLNSYKAFQGLPNAKFFLFRNIII